MNARKLQATYEHYPTLPEGERRDLIEGEFTYRDYLLLPEGDRRELIEPLPDPNPSC